MNIILFEPQELGLPLPAADPRARHLLEVLRRRPGDQFDAGMVDGPRGKGTLLSAGADGLRLAFEWGEAPPPLDPITLILGLPRPQTARRLLQEASALGVQAMHFVTTERGEQSYAHSRLWSTGEWRRHLVAGAAQAFSTRLPALTYGRGLQEVIDGLEASACRLALDNYEAAFSLANAPVRGPVLIALGSERGWSARERDLLREKGFVMAHLGERVLRTETACVAAVAVVKARLGLMPDAATAPDTTPSA